MIKIGNGFDAHKSKEGLDLVLGGVKIPCSFGLVGHSDADVLVHAVMDALLGAGGFPDIGQLFPDTDQAYKDISSLFLLRSVAEILAEKKYRIINIDSIIVAQKPRVAPYLAKMKRNIAETLKISDEKINIKATTTEGLGYCGRGEGISSYAVCLLEKISE